MLPIDAMRWFDAMCYPSLQNTDPQAYWIMWAGIGAFSVVSGAFVAYAEQKGWPVGTGWIKALLTPVNTELTHTAAHAARIRK